MWYEKFNFEESPYDIRNLSSELIGEDDQEKKFVKWIANRKSILLHGPTGVGKTTLSRNIADKINNGEIKELKKFKCLFYSCDKDDLSTFSRKYKKTRWLSFGKKIIVFLDEAHFADDKDLIRVSAYWDSKKVSAVAYIQINEKPRMDQLVRRIGIHKIKMKTILQEEIIELLKQRTGETSVFEKDALTHIAG